MFKPTNSKKSQVIIVSIMVSILVLILVVILSSPLKHEITRSINGTYSGNLSTGNTNMSAGNQATVVILDMGIFYFIAILIASSIAYISGRKSIIGAVTAIMVFVITSVLITPLKSLIILARDSGHLDCANVGISVGNRLGCIVLDIWLFYFVVVAISVAGSLLFLKKVIKK